MLNSNTLHCHNLIMPSYYGFLHFPASESPQSYHFITVTVTNVTISKKGNYTSFNTHFSSLSEYDGPLLIQCVWNKLYSIQALSLSVTCENPEKESCHITCHLSLVTTSHIVNTTGMGNPYGSWVRVAMGAGAGQHFATRARVVTRGHGYRSV
jgi:hypothetical protein